MTATELEILETIQQEVTPIIVRLIDHGMSTRACACGLISFGIGILDGNGMEPEAIDAFLDKVVKAIKRQREERKS